MIYLKECPKCKGDLNTREDVDGQFLSCIQCGYMKDLPSEPQMDIAPYTDGETFLIDAPKAPRKRRKKVRQAA
jgi:hypothetical protein